jgi:hypothetical protein
MDLSVANLVRQAFKDLHTQHHNHLAIPQQASVEPHMALNSLALEPQLAWQATLEVLPAFAQSRFTPPENWPAWIECLAPTGWLLNALGEFPQRLAMDSVLEGDTASPTLADTPPLPQGNSPADHLLTASLLRQAGQLENAAARLNLVSEPAWTDCITSERAALQWQQGNYSAAEKLWLSCQPSPGTLYNRALARRIAGDNTQASTLFNQAAAAWPETSPWHHLARVCELVT